MKRTHKIKFSILLTIVSLIMALGFNLKPILAETVSLIPGREISLSNFNGNLNNINIKIEFDTSVDLDGVNNALLVGLVSSDGTLLTDSRFVVKEAKEGIILDDGTAILFEDNMPLAIGKKTSDGYSIETKDFTIVNSSKNISKLVIIGQRGTEIKADIKASEVKYSIKFGNEETKVYSYNELITAPETNVSYDLTTHTNVTRWETSDKISFISGTTIATKDMTFSAIGEKKNHSWTDVSEVPATKDKSGIKAHQVCSCGAMRLNSSSNTLVTESELINPALNHTCSYKVSFDWTNALNPGDKPIVKYECSECGLTKIIEDINISLKEKPGSKVPSTCDRGGSITYIAETSYEGVNAKDEKTYSLPKTTHVLECVAEIPSTCTTPGSIEHYHCNICGNNYSDELGTSLIEDISLLLSHHLLKVDALDPICERDGNIEHYYCSDCQRNFDEEGRLIASVVVRSPGHSYNENGKCSICGKTKPNHNQPTKSGCFSNINSLYMLALLGLAIPVIYKKKKEQ